MLHFCGNISGTDQLSLTHYCHYDNLTQTKDRIYISVKLSAGDKLATGTLNIR